MESEEMMLSRQSQINRYLYQQKAIIKVEQPENQPTQYLEYEPITGRGKLQDFSGSQLYGQGITNSVIAFGDTVRMRGDKYDAMPRVQNDETSRSTSDTVDAVMLYRNNANRILMAPVSFYKGSNLFGSPATIDEVDEKELFVYKISKKNLGGGSITAFDYYSFKPGKAVGSFIDNSLIFFFLSTESKVSIEIKFSVIGATIGSAQAGVSINKLTTFSSTQNPINPANCDAYADDSNVSLQALLPPGGHFIDFAAIIYTQSDGIEVIGEVYLKVEGLSHNCFFLQKGNKSIEIFSTRNTSSPSPFITYTPKNILLHIKNELQGATGIYNKIHRFVISHSLRIIKQETFNYPETVPEIDDWQSPWIISYQNIFPIAFNPCLRGRLFNGDFVNILNKKILNCPVDRTAINDKDVLTQIEIFNYSIKNDICNLSQPQTIKRKIKLKKLIPKYNIDPNYLYLVKISPFYERRTVTR